MVKPNSFLQSPFQSIIDDADDDNAPASLIGSQAVQSNPLPDIPVAKGVQEDAAPDAPTASSTEPVPSPAAVTGAPRSLLPPESQRPLFEATAAHFKVPVNVLMAIAQQESSYNSDARNKDTGAAGPVQYMDATAKALRINPNDPNEAIPAAAQQLRERLDKGYSIEDAVKEHFAGPNRKLWGAKTAAYGDEVLAKAGAIGQELYGADNGGDQAAPADAAPQSGPEQNQFAPNRMKRADYEKEFRALNPRASDAAVQAAMTQYDQAQAARTTVAGNRVQSKFAALQSPEAMFDAKLNARLQGPANGVVPQLPANQQPDMPVSQTVTPDAPSTLDTVGGNFIGGALNTLVGAGAAGARLVGADDVAADWDEGRKQIQARLKELGGDTFAGKVSSLVGGIVPALGVPEGLLEQAAGNAGLYAIPAFQDTLKQKLSEGQPRGLALVHAAEAAGINLLAPTVMQKGAGALIGRLTQEGVPSAAAAALTLGQAAGEGAAFSVANTVLDKGTDLIAGQKNDHAWIDPEDIAVQATGFGALRAGHIAGHAVGEAIGERAGAAEAAQEPSGPLSAALGNAAQVKARGGSVADQLRAIRDPNEPAPAQPDAAGGPLESSLVDAAAQHAVDPAPPVEVPQPQAKPQPPDLTSLSMDDLRARMRDVAQQARDNPEQRTDLQAERKRVEQEISARGDAAMAQSKPASEPLSVGPFEDMKSANAMMERHATETGAPHEVVKQGEQFVVQPVGGGDGINIGSVGRSTDGRERSGGSAGGVGSTDGAANRIVERSTDASGRRGLGGATGERLSNPGGDRVVADGAGNASAPVAFKTSKGSTYIVNSNGTTTRNKAARAEHPGEKGPQNASKRTIYMTHDEMGKLAEMQAKGGARKGLIFHDGEKKVAIRYLDGKDAGKIEGRTVASFQTEPSVGLHPVESWGDNYSIHFGNEITEITHSAVANPYRTRAFPDQAKAEAFIDKNDINRNHFEVTQTGPVRWQITPRSKETVAYTPFREAQVEGQDRKPVPGLTADFDNGHGSRGVMDLGIKENRLYPAWVDAGLPSGSTGGRVRAMYERAIDEADKRGLQFTSDDSVTTDASHVYDSLQKRGYIVKKNPNAKLVEPPEVLSARWRTDDGSPVYTVEKAKESANDVPQRQEVPEEAPAASREEAAQPPAAVDDKAVQGAGADAAPAKPKRQPFPRELTNARQDEAVRQAAEALERRKAEKAQAEATKAEPEPLPEEVPQPTAEKAPAPTESATPVETKPEPKLSLGRTPNSAEAISVRDGVVHIGEYPAQDFETGHDIKVAEGATPQDIKEALMNGGAIGRGQKVFGMPKEVPMLHDFSALMRDGRALELRSMATNEARGAEDVRNILNDASEHGLIRKETADFALWALKKSPSLATDLGVRIRDLGNRAAAGSYDPAERILTLAGRNAPPRTAVHEILHHSERMMPRAIQDGILKAWEKARAQAYEGANEQTRQSLDDMRDMATSIAAQKRVIDAFGDGRLDYDAHYQLSNPSEYWAVNATRIMGERYGANTWQAKAKQWLSEMVEKIKGLLHLPSDAPVLAGLRAVLDGTGERMSSQMLVERSGEHIDELYDIVPPQEGDPAEPEVPPTMRQKLSQLISRPVGQIKSSAYGAFREGAMLVSPMVTGPSKAQAMTKTYINNLRRAQEQWKAMDTVLVRNYSETDLRKMWEAADQENDLRREGQTSDTAGLNSLPADQREVVDVLHSYGEQLWKRAKDAGLVSGDGVAYWTPRVAANIYADGSVEGIRQPAVEFSKDATNLKTSASSTKARRHETTEESEAALKAKLGDDAAYVKNIRVMPMAMAQLETAIAGRTLVNQIKAHGQATGNDLVRDSDTGDKNFDTIKHPALTRWVPRMKEENGQMVAVKDSDGNTILEAKPLFIRKDFLGPLRSVLKSDMGSFEKPYRFFMALKGASMSMIMLSPATHMAVIWGKAMPSMLSSMGWKNNLKNFATAGAYTYMVGHQYRQDRALMNELVEGGLSPIGGRGMNPDLEAIGNGIKPGRSLIAKALGKVLDVASPAAGDAGRKAVDAAGHFWHETLLWDRIGDMQAGMAVQMRNHFMDNGIDQYTATRLATHFANRYAGAVPQEALSQGANALANVLLFSKSFTGTNLGAMKDPIVGLPSDVRAQIREHFADLNRTLGMNEIQAYDSANKVVKQAQSAARKKAAVILMADFGAMAVINSLTQAWFKSQSGQEFLDDFNERTHRLGIKLEKENPLSFLGPVLGKIGLPIAALRHPFENLDLLSQTSDNPHGKQDRVRIGEDGHGNTYYLRHPFGKVTEEMKSYTNVSSATNLMENKASPLAKSAVESWNNKDFYGRSIYDKDANPFKQAGQIVGHILKAQVPFDDFVALKNLMGGGRDNGDKVHMFGADMSMDQAKLMGTATGLSVSKLTGGDALAEMRYQYREQQQKLNNILPDVKDAVVHGEHEKAIQLLQDAGQTGPEISHTMRSLMAPNVITPGRMNRFMQHATPEDAERINRMIQKK